MNNKPDGFGELFDKVEKAFESSLWYSRLLLVFGVISCLFTGFAMIILGVVEVFHLFDYLASYVFDSASSFTRGQIILYVVKIIDTFLVSSILFIFSFGLYELFISPMNKTGEKEFASKAFEITSIDELKAKLGKVIVMLLVIKVFAYLVELKPINIIETLYIAIIVFLLAMSLWFGHKK